MTHIKSIACLSLLLSLAAGVPKLATAGVYTDELAKCLVENTSDDDKIALAKWIFTVISVHPSAKTIATISDSDRTAVAQNTGAIFEELLADSCASQTTKAIKYEGNGALEASFKVLGEIAMNTLLTDAAVAAESQNFVKFVDEAKLQAVFEGKVEAQ